MNDDAKIEIIAEMGASAPRRMMAYGVLMILGALLVYLGMTSAVGFGGQVAFVAMGIGALVFGEGLRRATQAQIILTDTGVFEQGGRQIADMTEIVSVERGAFALKPSHGFSLVMRHRQTRHWAPGMWWRFGKRVGVGGVTASGAGKFMAEQIALRIAARDATP